MARRGGWLPAGRAMVPLGGWAHCVCAALIGDSGPMVRVLVPMAELRTVPDVLAAAVRAHPDREAYVHGDRRVSYADLERASAGLAATLRAFGVGRGDVVCLLLPSSPDFAAAYLGAMRAGAITSAVNQRLGPSERASIIERTSPSVTIALDDQDVPAGAGRVMRQSELGFAFAAPRGEDIALEPTDTAAIVWTSGTTGAPKGAIYDHESMRVIHEGMGDLTVSGDRRVVSLPFAHVGYMTRIWDELAAGTTLVLVGEPWNATDQIELIERERITMATGVPTQWELMLAHPALDSCDKAHLRLAAVGGASVAPDLVRRMRERLGCPVITRYASTEGGLLTGTRVTDDDETVANTVGVPSEVVELTIVDLATEAPAPVATVGEVRTRSRAMFRGYWGDPELTAATLDSEGRLKTGDLGFVGTDGNLRLVGRSKEMYIRGGYNVYPAEVESVLSDHPALRQAAVVGTPAPVLGEVGVAFVVVEPAATIPELAELRAWCRQRLADYKAPDRLVVVKALPVTAGQKIDKVALAAAAKETD
jgi:acyl-CoA synthetase (AMP-forming)/AMP-acid ligase II